MADRHLNVLIADDDKVLTQVIYAALKKAGCRVTVALDAMQAVMFAVREPPDVIVLDIGMPGGSGLNALTKLKASSKTRLIPVLVMSGLRDVTLPQQVHDLGAAEFVAKPIDLEALYPRLRRLLETAREKRQRVLDALSQLTGPSGTDVATVHDLLAKNQTPASTAEVEAVLEGLRTDHKAFKRQGNWFAT
jgi:DNA-binding response OmpR family regulator